MLPASFERFDARWNFNQPIDKVVWPASLNEFMVVGRYIQRIDNVNGPPP